jgi:hypothetical protein
MSEDRFDAELSELLAQHHAAEEEIGAQLHIRDCACCHAVAILVGNLRRDLWTLLDRGSS